MDIPSVTNFLVGFEKAIKEENKDIEVLSQYANSFTDSSKGRVIAEQMIKNKADIIFTAGGGVNFGVFEACKEKNIKAIGVDMPSNYIEPNTIITSALKNVGVGVELTIQDLVNEQFEGGKVKMFDLNNGGVGYEITDHLSQDLIKYVDSKINK
jgi:basic membrane protein A